MRRQMKRDFRKPMIVMSPKSLLRHPKAVSTLEELANGGFQEVIDDASVKDAKKVKTVAFVSGKLYYELLEEKEKAKKDDLALVRLEQIYPFPEKQIAKILKNYSNAKTVVWTQEEPKNMGAWQHVYFKFVELFESEKLKLNIKYIGRPERSSPATGSIYRHKNEQNEIIQGVIKE
jgi:2-oxoglutarate dehydrogenase E1 component